MVFESDAVAEGYTLYVGESNYHKLLFTNLNELL
jgi:hypothetical protein